MSCYVSSTLRYVGLRYWLLPDESSTFLNPALRYVAATGLLDACDGQSAPRNRTAYAAIYRYQQQTSGLQRLARRGDAITRLIAAPATVQIGPVRSPHWSRTDKPSARGVVRPYRSCCK